MNINIAPSVIHNQSDLTSSTSFRDILSGEKAFYNQPNYLRATYRDFAKERPLANNYTWNTPWWETESEIVRIAKKIFSIALLGMDKLCHIIAGMMIIPASGYSNNDLTEIRLNIADNLLTSEWKYKRITVAVDGYKVDAMILGKASTLDNGRWILVSNGNGECYEGKLSRENEFHQILTQCNANSIVFNYPGVGASSGHLNRQATVKAYRAMLGFLEDQNGIGAKEIIGYGFSLGGGVQGDALKTHQLENDIKYVFVKSRTFSNLSATASVLMGKIFGIAVKIFGWNIGSIESSKKLQVYEIIMQTANIEEDYEELHDSSKIIDDGVIPAEVSLAKVLLDDDMCPREHKTFIGMKEGHSEALRDPSFLAGKINTLLEQTAEC